MRYSIEQIINNQNEINLHKLTMSACRCRTKRVTQLKSLGNNPPGFNDVGDMAMWRSVAARQHEQRGNTALQTSRIAAVLPRQQTASPYSRGRMNIHTVAVAGGLAARSGSDVRRSIPQSRQQPCVNRSTWARTARLPRAGL